MKNITNIGQAILVRVIISLVAFGVMLHSRAVAANFDEVRIWNVARSDADIVATYNTRIGSTAAGLVQNFHLDDGSGTATTPIVDAAGTASGVNVNASWVPSSLSFTGEPALRTISSFVSNNASVQLSAVINPNGAATDYYFQYGATIAYGNST